MLSLKSLLAEDILIGGEEGFVGWGFGVLGERVGRDLVEKCDFCRAWSVMSVSSLEWRREALTIVSQFREVVVEGKGIVIHVRDRCATCCFMLMLLAFRRTRFEYARVIWCGLS